MTHDPSVTQLYTATQIVWQPTIEYGKLLKNLKKMGSMGETHTETMGCC